MYGAQLKLRPDKKIELIVEPMDQQSSITTATSLAEYVIFSCMLGIH